MTLFPKFKIDSGVDSATLATPVDETDQDRQKVAKVAESQRPSFCSSTSALPQASNKTPGPWFDGFYNMKPVGRTIGGVIVAKTYDMAYDNDPNDPTPPTCHECRHLYKDRYCKVIYRRGMPDLRYALAPNLDKPWHCPDFKLKE